MAPKRQRKSGDGSSRQEEPPVWGSNVLSSFPERWQSILYKRKLGELKSFKDAIVAERNVRVGDLRHYGLIEGFERLGWEAALTFNSEKRTEIYINEIVEWMSTLRRVEGDNPPWTVKLIGVVNGVSVEFSFQSVREIANIDSLERGEYEIRSDAYLKGEIRGEEWLGILSEIFEVPDHELSENMVLWAYLLKPLPRLVFKLLLWNIVPRKGDRTKVRTYDVRIIHAIVTGEVKFPFYQVMLMGIWDSHESSTRKVIPFCRTLSKLLVNRNVLGRNAKAKNIAAIPFDKAHLPRNEFAFTETVFHYILHDLAEKRLKRFVKPVPEGMQEDGAEGEEQEFDNYGERGEAQPYPGRPPAYQNWDNYQRMTWDNNQHHWEEQRLRDEAAERRRASFEERVEERLTRFDRRLIRMEENVAVQGYYQQRYHYDLFDWTEQQRHWADFNDGREYQLHTPRQDFSVLRRSDGSSSSQQPTAHPEMNHPEWWPGEYRSHPGNASSSSRDNPEVVDPFDTLDLAKALYEGSFGPNR